MIYIGQEFQSCSDGHYGCYVFLPEMLCSTLVLVTKQEIYVKSIINSENMLNIFFLGFTCIFLFNLRSYQYHGGLHGSVVWDSPWNLLKIIRIIIIHLLYTFLWLSLNLSHMFVHYMTLQQ